MPNKRLRTRSGCSNCRRRRRKCDETHPTCERCSRHSETCHWSSPITFKDDNTTVLTSQHPSMKYGLGNLSSVRQFEILDVTQDVIQEYHRSQSSDEFESEDPRRRSRFASNCERTSFSGHDISPMATEDMDLGLVSSQNSDQDISMCLDPLLCGEPRRASPFLTNGSQITAGDTYKRSNDLSPGSISTSPGDNSIQPQTHSNLTNISFGAHTIASMDTRPRSSSHNTYARTEAAAEELMALRYPLNKSHESIPACDVFSPQISEISPHMQTVSDDPFEIGCYDGIFVPGSTYQELHTTLRNHIIESTKSDARFRYESPDINREAESIYHLDDRPILADNHAMPTASPPSITLTLKQEYVLWNNYITEVGPWLDMFNNKHHFTHKVSVMAEKIPHLKYSILACSARQMERKDPKQPSSGSLALYQKAIHLLLPNLQSKDSAVIASCVVLCVLEMMSCNPKEWRRHLDGCAVLLEAIGTEGFVSELDQALFWCYARMDLCGGLISQEETIIPIESWGHHGGLVGDNRFFRNTSRSWDMYANYAVFLCAAVVNFLFSPRDDKGEDSQQEWQDLFEQIEIWHRERPEEIRPVITIPASKKGDESPFPTILYRTGAAVSANQLYHTSAMLLLQAKPKDVHLDAQRGSISFLIIQMGALTLKQKSFVWHARQICGISESNQHHGSWVNALQPLWIAGKVMSHPSEHQIILNMLATIERETGWGTAWRANDLREYWGDDE